MKFKIDLFMEKSDIFFTVMDYPHTIFYQKKNINFEAILIFEVDIEFYYLKDGNLFYILSAIKAFLIKNGTKISQKQKKRRFYSRKIVLKSYSSIFFTTQLKSCLNSNIYF